jgi:ABC-type multidrug transport system fused ATPase/permease subunit
MMFAVMKQMVHIKDSEHTDAAFTKSAEFKGEIVFENMSFAYPTDEKKNVIRDFSHTFESNKTTALYGYKAGKSTLIHLIERNYDPRFGHILIDGKQIEELEINSLRRKIGYVGEDPFIFKTTIRENMRFAAPEASDA